MQRTFLYVAAFTGMGAVFAAGLIVTALLFGVADRAGSGAASAMNEGLQIHPMHLHGIPQLVVAKDGYALPQPHYEDTVLVAPGERIDVLVETTEVGTWAFHCHILTHAEGPNGMFGMVTALVVQE